MNSRKLMYVMLGILGLALAGTGAGIYYGYGLLQQNVQSANHIKIDAELNDQAQSSLSLMQQKFQDPSIQKLSDYLNQIVPSAAYRSQFVPDIYAYAQHSNVTISGLSFDAAPTVGPRATSAVPTPPGSTPMPVTVSIDKGSTFSEFTDFVKALENNLEHVQITTLTMTPDASDPNKLASANITLQVFIAMGK